MPALRRLVSLFALALPLPAFAAPPAEAPVEVAPALFATGIPELPPSLGERLLQYQNTRSAAFQDWAPTGGLLITTRFGDTDQVHQVRGPMGARTQLTFEREPVREVLTASTVRGRPGFFYSKDVGGSESYQIFAHDLGTGRSRLVTDGQARNVSKVLSPDGQRLAWASTARNGRDFDLWVMEVGGEPRLLAETQGSWEPVDWSPDGRELLVRNFVSINDASYHRVDTTTGAMRPLVPKAKTPAGVGPAAYARDAVFYVTDAFGEHRELTRVDLKTGEVRRLTRDIPWEVEALDVSVEGDRLAFVTNEDGISRLHLWELGALRPLAAKLPALPAGVVSGLRFDPKGEQLAFSLTAAASAGDVYTLTSDGAKLERWTQSEVGGLNPATFVTPELVRFPTFDRVGGKPRQIPAFYYRPEGPGPFPVVVLIHGGPESQYRPGFSPLVQAWVRELGVAVVAPNVRGSAGYGKSYLLLDNGRKREDSVKDIGALLDWVKTRPELDAARVGVYGGSYGGYMVLASMARYPERIRAGAEIVGISNFVTFLESTQEYRRDLRRAEYGDERDPAMRKFLEGISPTTLAGRITAPLFVAQGLNDPRVPAGEAEQIVQLARGRGAPVWYLLAHDEGHGFAKKKNRDYYTAALTHFWQTHLLPAGAGGAR